MRPSRLSSDGDLLNSIRLRKRQTLSLGGRKYRLNNVETTSIAGMTKESTSGKRYDDETASDDDSEDNPMVKSYQKNLDFYSKRACDFGIAFWIGKFRNNSFRNFSLDFFLLWIDVSFFWALDRFSWIG
ncbi:unnamed protein product [Rhizophagus irregularis]|nr:unnamed protein product [Rhizophagus irregularis]